MPLFRRLGSLLLPFLFPALWCVGWLAWFAHMVALVGWFGAFVAVGQVLLCGVLSVVVPIAACFAIAGLGYVLARWWDSLAIWLVLYGLASLW